MKNHHPPFTLTPTILGYTQSIFQHIGRLEGAKLICPSIKLRKSNQIKTIHASLAIEGNTLTIHQMTDLLKGKRVLGPAKDILEVKNALKIYDKLETFDPLNLQDFLNAHRCLMKDLVAENGCFRSRGVGIFQGKKLAHVAPSPKRVPQLMEDLFTFLTTSPLSWLLKSCIFHYELEFIHPFMDGNGRMGRLWQQLLLMKEHQFFAFIPVEEIIKDHQEKYYDTLSQSDRAGESTTFVEFSLETILQALKCYEQTPGVHVHDAWSRLAYARNLLSQQQFGRKDYHAIHPDISLPTASRDLNFGVIHQILVTTGGRNQVRYQFHSVAH